MAWRRFLVYFLAVALVTAALTQMEVAAPGSLKLHILPDARSVHGTSELSPIEIIQSIILVLCASIMAWVARHCASQRTLAIAFGGMALVFLVRENDYFLDRYVIDNLWQVLVVVAGAMLIVYVQRHRRRLSIGLARTWPSPGLTLLFAGAVILFAFVPFVGHEPLWQAILGPSYQRVIKLAIEEFIELGAYFLWMIGTVEYALQARAIAHREPQPAAQRRRQKRRHDRQGKA